jgi:hypothetical protein
MFRNMTRCVSIVFFGSFEYHQSFESLPGRGGSLRAAFSLCSVCGLVTGGAGEGLTGFASASASRGAGFSSSLLPSLSG